MWTCGHTTKVYSGNLNEQIHYYTHLMNRSVAYLGALWPSSISCTSLLRSFSLPPTTHHPPDALIIRCCGSSTEYNMILHVKRYLATLMQNIIHKSMQNMFLQTMYCNILLLFPCSDYLSLHYLLILYNNNSVFKTANNTIIEYDKTFKFCST